MDQSKPELHIGQEVIGKFFFSNGPGRRPALGFPHGHIIEITDKGFKVAYKAIIGPWTYKYEDIGAIVYTMDQDAEGMNAELIDRMMEEERLGIEDE